MYKVSILVPVYGVERYIERCARSLFGQTYPNLEYVFVNDCTPDRSLEILQQVLEDYPERKASVKIINHEKNRGLAAARNTALDNATAEFVSHVDSDDWLEPDAIEALVKSQKETGADMVSGNMYVHTIHGVEEYREPNYESKEHRILKLLPASLDHNAIRRIVRRSLYENNHIRCLEGCDMSEDRYQMVQLCWFAKCFGTIDGFVYHYDMNRPESYTKKTHWKRRLECLMQELRNWLGIRAFLSDKGEVYYNEATSFTIDCIKKAMKLALKHSDKTHFKELASIVRDNEDLAKKIGWKANDLGVLMQSYPVMWLRNSCNRAIGYASNLFNSER